MLEPSSEASGQRPAVHTLLSLVLSAATGAALGLGLLVAFFLPNIHLGEKQRIIELGRHLEAPPGALPRLAFVGDSITMDGIDAEIVQEHAPYRLTAENLGMSGAGPNERRVLLPKLLATRPALVALGFHPANLCRLDALRIDKAYAYARAGFVAAWTAGRTLGDFAGMSPGSFAALHSSAFAQILHFRTAPVEAFEHRLRALLRPDLRLGLGLLRLLRRQIGHGGRHGIGGHRRSPRDDTAETSTRQGNRKEQAAAERNLSIRSLAAPLG